MNVKKAWLAAGVIFPAMLLLRLLFAAELPEAEPRAGFFRQTMTHNGVSRQYYAYYPAALKPGRPAPLLFVLHGGMGADAQTLAERTGFNAIADREGFIVVYPAGIDGQWNDGRGRTFRRAAGNSGIDDVGFVSELIDQFVGRGEADAARVFVTGISNGGMMAHRLGIALGDKLAAIAPVIANLPATLAREAPARGLPVLIMNGTLDPMMPWNGGFVRVLGRNYGMVLSTGETVRFWTLAARLNSRPVEEMLPDTVPADKCRVVVSTYSREESPVEVVLYAVEGGGHNLPGGGAPDRPRLLGSKCMDINGAEVIWSFFLKHAPPEAESVPDPAATGDLPRPRPDPGQR